MAYTDDAAQVRTFTGLTTIFTDADYTNLVDEASLILDKDTGKSSGGWDTTDDFYKLVQMAEAFQIAHLWNTTQQGAWPQETLQDPTQTPRSRQDNYEIEYHKLVTKILDLSRRAQITNRPYFRRVSG